VPVGRSRSRTALPQLFNIEQDPLGRADVAERDPDCVRLYKAALFSVAMYGADDPAARHDPRYPL
jgi:hypothetical protein